MLFLTHKVQQLLLSPSKKEEKTPKKECSRVLSSTLLEGRLVIAGMIVTREEALSWDYK